MPEQTTGWVSCLIGACQRHQACMYTPCRRLKYAALAADPSHWPVSPTQTTPDLPVTPDMLNAARVAFDSWEDNSMLDYDDMFAAIYRAMEVARAK